MKTSNKVQNAKNRSHRGELPGDKQVKRNKRSTGVARIPQGETLPEAIKRDRLMSHATPRPVSSRGKQLQKQQVDRAYRSLNLTSGTYDAWISATFMQRHFLPIVDVPPAPHPVWRLPNRQFPFSRRHARQGRCSFRPSHRRYSR